MRAREKTFLSELIRPETTYSGVGSCQSMNPRPFNASWTVDSSG